METVIKGVQEGQNNIIFDRNEIRTMAKDLISLREASVSQKKEVFLDIPKATKEVEVENERVLKEKQKIENLINSLSSFKEEDPKQEEVVVSKEEEPKQEKETLRSTAVVEEEPKKEEVAVIKEEEPKQEEVVEELEPAVKIPTKEEKLDLIEKEILKIEEAQKTLKEEMDPFLKSISNAENGLKIVKSEIKEIKQEEKRINLEKLEIEKKERNAEERERREIEQRRWEIEKKRNDLESKRYLKEDEFKSVKLQIKEIELKRQEKGKEFFDLEKAKNKLKKQKTTIFLMEKKESFLKDLERITESYKMIKEKLIENIQSFKEVDGELRNVVKTEVLIEKEIVNLEEMNRETEEIIQKRRIEDERRDKEVERREIEQRRWELEDQIKSLKERRERLRADYMAFLNAKQSLEDKIMKLESQIL